MTKIKNIIDQLTSTSAWYRLEDDPDSLVLERRDFAGHLTGLSTGLFMIEVIEHAPDEDGMYPCSEHRFDTFAEAIAFAHTVAGNS